jgi:hypothetical protein
MTSALAVFSLAFRLGKIVGGRRIISYGYLITAAIFCLYGIYLYLTGDYERFISTIGWPNQAAAYLVPGVVLLLDRTGLGEGKKWFIWPATALLLTSFWLTSSRGAALVFVLAMVALGLLRRAGKTYWITIVLSILVTTLLSTGVAQLRHSLFQKSVANTTVSRVGDIANESTTSFSDRLYYLKSAGQIWLDNPVLGTGAGTFGTVHPRYQERVISNSQDVHDIYAQSFAEQGIVGGVLLIALAVLLIQGTIRGVRNEPRLLPWGLGFLALLVHFGIDMDGRYPVIIFLLVAWAGLLWWPRTAKLRLGRPSLVPPLVLAGALALTYMMFSSNQANSLGLSDQAALKYSDAVSDFDAAHQGLVYDSNTLNEEANNLYVLAQLKTSPKLNYAAALDLTERTEKQVPDNAYNYDLQGHILESLGDPQAALVAYK